MHFVERIWHGHGATERTARTMLAPAAWGYAAATALRNALYDRGVLHTQEPLLPALSLGNLSVGGTGKTPVAAWAAAELRARGASPALVLRGYGGDEPLVHGRLNPDVPVIVNADRVRGAAEAARLGADCVVLDDAFQHRRIARVADWVLVSAEQWDDGGRRLPAGPLREPARALKRASLVVITRKSSTAERAADLADRLSLLVPDGRAAVMHLAPDALVEAASTRRKPLAWLQGARILAVAAIGDPASYFAQLRALGADVHEMAFRDHHHFTDGDVQTIVEGAGAMDGVVCTLKDAVKLVPLWYATDVPLWYVSQAVTVDRGDAELGASLTSLLAARVHPF